MNDPPTIPGVDSYAEGLQKAVEEVKPTVPTTEHEEEIMTPGEVARLFRVDPKTVRRWAIDGRLPSIVTPGGHHRFYRADVLDFIAQARTGGQVV